MRQSTVLLLKTKLNSTEIVYYIYKNTKKLAVYIRK